MSAGDPDLAIARTLRLRSAPPPVVRLSRRAVALAAGAAALAVGAVTVWSVGVRRTAPAQAPVPVAVAAARPPEQLAALPRDYSGLPPGVPRLGPPLPGDFGRPLLGARAGAAPAGAAVRPGEDPAAMARRAARASRLFATLAERPAAAAAAIPATAAGGSRPMPGDGADPPAAAGLVRTIPAGTSLRAALLTGIRSDLPGPVIAQLTEDVLDAAGGGEVLLPRGSRVVGAYDNRVAFGQSRVLVTWSALVLPDGRSVALGEAPATDAIGAAGLADRVDRHWRQLAAASLVSLGLAGAGEMGGRSEADAIAEALRRGAGDTAAGAGGQVVGRSLSVAPTVTVRPGTPVRVLLVRPLALAPRRR